MNSHAEGDLRLPEIYALSGLPERTAQYLFKQELGMTAKTYITGQRLHAAHSALWLADPFTATVSGIANQFGFWHMRQFARDYRKIYGVNPSATLALDKY
jgi:AraC family ethanolamine operon transcriptional activator